MATEHDYAVIGAVIKGATLFASFKYNPDCEKYSFYLNCDPNSGTVFYLAENYDLSLAARKALREFNDYLCAMYDPADILVFVKNFQPSIAATVTDFDPLCFHKKYRPVVLNFEHMTDRPLDLD